MDLIERQAAIDAIGKESDAIYRTKKKGATYPHDDFFQGMAYAESTIKNLPSAQHKERTETRACDLISRQAAIDVAKAHWYKPDIVGAIEQLPSAQHKIKPIGYRDCANAMMKMWMDNVVTDGEYNRIMDKLNAHWAERREE